MQQAKFLALAMAALVGLSCAHAQLSSSDMLALAQVEPERAFGLWAAQHSRTYSEGSPEYTRRLGVFVDNVRAIAEQHRRDPGVTLALNEYADETWSEFAAKRLGLTITPEQLAAKEARSTRLQASGGWRYADVAAPTAVDWRSKNAVSEVKNQGQCGSCWAFSAVGSIEGANALATGQLVALSEQQLVDCDTASNMGCSGGLMDDAFKYVIDNGGIDTEDDYSYWSGYGFGFWCNKRKQTDRPAVSIDGYEDVPTNEPALVKAVSGQPVAVAICAGANMQFYSKGVISSCCEGLNHGVLAVGYDVSDKAQPYWIVKNSWGGSWGEQGYFRLKMGEGPKGLCGIASAASYAVKTSAANKPVPEMCDMFGWTECPVGNTCSCSFSLFGWLCLWHDCCPLANAVSCPDLQHCCPAGTTCDSAQGACISTDGASSSPWVEKTKATVANTAAARARQAEVEAAQAKQEQQRGSGARGSHAIGEGEMLLAQGGAKGGERKRIERIAPQ
ncbi:hypothetical protein HXX76_009787 [Chlamydomonas incerta]|uniref:Granulins domain-containing protein n=1 Tax=Chlamydomonas incerta TaxID=51695 RepID=A0A835VZL2_CHLIN|nr:hypothetical protein HXX76_009787 [Chlamydomonas incerta]|eukprot:KAG2430811.1 hypothetical protein HXX76_009787 [Chlamydomonas incerta]